MRLLALIAGLICCLGVALDAFQTIILPRRPAGRLRITQLFFILTWAPWRALAPRIGSKKVREQAYSIYGPLSLLMLLALWALLLVLGFALFFFALGSPFQDSFMPASSSMLTRFRTDLYVSGTTLFTLGLGDVVPRIVAVRALLIMESGVGLGTGGTGHRICAGTVPGVLAAGGERGTAGCTRGIAADGDGVAATTWIQGRAGGVEGAAGRVGTVVSGDTGVAHLVPDSLLLPITA